MENRIAPLTIYTRQAFSTLATWIVNLMTPNSHPCTWTRRFQIRPLQPYPAASLPRKSRAAAASLPRLAGQKSSAVISPSY